MFSLRRAKASSEAPKVSAAAAERIATLERLGLNPDDPSDVALATASGWVAAGTPPEPEPPALAA